MIRIQLAAKDHGAILSINPLNSVSLQSIKSIAKLEIVRLEIGYCHRARIQYDGLHHVIRASRVEVRFLRVQAMFFRWCNPTSRGSG